MRVLFVDTVDPILKDMLEKRNYRCETAYYKKKEEIEKIIHKYDGIIIRSRFKIDKQLIDKAINLKFIARAGSGLENINVTYARKKGIKCYSAAEGNKQAVAEHALGMLLSLFNNLTKCNSEIREGKWLREQNRGLELSKKTVGIIGYGNNGSAFANLLRGFDVKILAYDKYLNKYPHQSTMQEIYRQCEILSLHVPLTPETTYLINNNFINKFKKNIYLINTARGKCVNTKDLISNLKNGKIRGACLDVFEHEKTSFEELDKENTANIQYLINSKKTILSPHVAGWTVESNIKIAKVLVKKISSL